MLSERIKRIRMEKGLTQAQLGEVINCSAMQVSRVEAGEAAFSSEQIEALASALGVEPVWLSTGTGPMIENDNSRDRRTIGERIYEIRRNRRLNQTEFAVLLGVSRNTISLLERRKISASQALIRAVVEKTGV